MRDPAKIFDESPDSIESMIRAAGNYVQPSEDLRPQALESAREHRDGQRTSRKLAGVTFLCLSLVGLVAINVDDMDSLLLRTTAPSTVEIQQEASALESLPHVGAEWGLAEAFTRLRRDQASWLAAHSLLK